MINVLLVDNQRLFREGVKALTDSQQDINIIGMAPNGQDAIAMITELVPDVVLMDVHMPDMDGIRATAHIIEMHPTVKVVLLTTVAEEELIIRGISVGADGFLLKELYPDTLHNAIRDAYRGQVVLSREIAQILAS
ncbi:response regulator [Virgibacillus sp. L01]|uniref:response regulator n=1 Tax=Virgibacillus sp. L01 TaxID=3457429 RepID=UPI003FD2D6DD